MKTNTGIKLWQLLLAVAILFGGIGAGFYEVNVGGTATNPKAVAQVTVKEWKLETFYRRATRPSGSDYRNVSARNRDGRWTGTAEVARLIPELTESNTAEGWGNLPEMPKVDNMYLLNSDMYKVEQTTTCTATFNNQSALINCELVESNYGDTNVIAKKSFFGGYRIVK